MTTKFFTFALIITLFHVHLTVSMAQDFDITAVYVEKDAEREQLIFTIEVAGIAGDSVPTAIGSLDGAPVLGYVFPTTLQSYDVGFDTTTGIVALALTSHPDFDDTPLWDENTDGDYANDGVIWHPHWVLLENNANVPGGLAVKATTSASVLPPTNPGMPMYMDSPGFPVVQSGNKISCTVPLYRMNHQGRFNYDGVTALMYVNTSNPSLPMLGVYNVYEVASGNLTLPYSVGKYSCDTLFMNISNTTSIGLVQPATIRVYPNPAATTIHVELDAMVGVYEVQVFNAVGALVYQQAINATTISIPTTSVGTNGTYFLSIVESSSGAIKASKQLVLH